MLQKPSKDVGVLPPIPKLPVPSTENSVPLGDSKAAFEVRLDFPIASGPFQPTWESIESNYPGTPEWLREAKFGIWVHFGPQSAGESGDWYARHLYKQGHHAYLNHLEKYGHPSEAGYMEVLRDWDPENLDPVALTKIYRDAGARFLLVQGVHHDNFDLWDSTFQPWNSVRLGPRRDLVGEWAAAARAAGMRYGVTFHHEYTWWWWQTAFGADADGERAGVPYDGHLTLNDGVGRWWEGLDPRLLYTVDLREYQGVTEAAHALFTPAPAGIFSRHTEYAKWYATWWALRMVDVIDRYGPDFIYTDGTGDQPFSGFDTGTGLKCDAMQRVMAHYYNQRLRDRGEVDVFSIVKFRPRTNGTVTTEEFGIPAGIKTDQPWVAEVPVGDWFYEPGFTYDSGMLIRYIVEAASRDGCAAICVSPRADGSLDEGSRRMLREVGEWIRKNGGGIYGSRAWKRMGEGDQVKGKLKMLPGGKLGREHAEFAFSTRDFRFTEGKDGAVYVYCLGVPEPGEQLKIGSLGTDSGLLDRRVRRVTALGREDQSLEWHQGAGELVIVFPRDGSYLPVPGFRVE